MIDLCKYCHLHGAEKDGYCSDSCRRSMELFRSARAVVKIFSSEHSPSAVRRLAKALAKLKSNADPSTPLGMASAKNRIRSPKDATS